jgi:hypothetical protein
MRDHSLKGVCCIGCIVTELSGLDSNEREHYQDVCKRCKNRMRIRIWRRDHPERSKEINRRYNTSEHYKKARAMYQKKTYITDKFKARQKLGHAVRNGVVHKVAHCESCLARPGADSGHKSPVIPAESRHAFRVKRHPPQPRFPYAG